MIRDSRRETSVARPPSLFAIALLGVFHGATACSPGTPPAAVTAPVSPTDASTAPTETPSTPAAPASADGGTTDVRSRRVQTLFVREAYADCEGEGPRKCLQVRASESEPWELFYARIEGFAYEEGNAYEVRVEVLPDPRPRADGSPLRYRLVEVVSKRQAPDGSRKP